MWSNIKTSSSSSIDALWKETGSNISCTFYYLYTWSVHLLFCFHYSFHFNNHHHKTENLIYHMKPIVRYQSENLKLQTSTTMTVTREFTFIHLVRGTTLELDQMWHHAPPHRMDKKWIPWLVAGRFLEADSSGLSQVASSANYRCRKLLTTKAITRSTASPSNNHSPTSQGIRPVVATRVPVWLQPC